VLVFGGIDYIFLTVGGNILAFFVIALTCHGELARRRPAARYLTSFYMWMSTGGMIGGIAAGLVAPHGVSWVAEYPILLGLALPCRPGLRVASGDVASSGVASGDVAFGRVAGGSREMLAWLLLLAFALVIVLAGPVFGYTLDDTRYKVAIGALLAVAVLFWLDPLKFAVLIALAFVTVRLYEPDTGVRTSVRSFFGVHKIIETTDGQFRTLQHGTTEHGAQRIRDANGAPIAGRPEPLTYYHTTSPIAQGIKAAR